VVFSSGSTTLGSATLNASGIATLTTAWGWEPTVPSQPIKGIRSIWALYRAPSL
jgi:hypothetical protein